MATTDYFSAIKKKMREDGKSEEDVKDFETKAAPYAKELLNNASEITFYTGESMEPDAMYAPLSSPNAYVHKWLTTSKAYSLPVARRGTRAVCGILDPWHEGGEGLE